MFKGRYWTVYLTLELQRRTPCIMDLQSVNLNLNFLIISKPTVAINCVKHCTVDSSVYFNLSFFSFNLCHNLLLMWLLLVCIKTRWYYCIGNKYTLQYKNKMLLSTAHSEPRSRHSGLNIIYEYNQYSKNIVQAFISMPTSWANAFDFCILKYK